MPGLSGHGARLFLVSSRPVPFTREPLERLPDGSWRICDPRRRLWQPGASVEADAGDGFAAVQVRRVWPTGGRVLVDRQPVGVRASGEFLPLLAAGTAEAWLLRSEPRMVAASTLGPRFRAAHAVPADAELVLAGCRLGEPVAGLRLLCELASGRARLDCVGAASADSDGRVRVRLEPALLEFA